MLTVEETKYHLRKAKQGVEESKEALIQNNLLLVKSIAYRFRNKGVDLEDLISLGSVGLMKAIYNFDEKYEVRFSTYAVPMILGEIKRFLRDDGEIKVSRIIKTQYRAITKYVEDYLVKNGVEPSVEEIATALNISGDDVVLALDSSKRPVSLYESIDDGEDRAQTLIEKLPSQETEDDRVDKLYVKSLINTLNERDKKLIILRYFRDKTQGEVAKILGVSQVQVSRLESKILKKLKEKSK
ncbi:MAG: SigB/SigF/SigG family RNA polymerase sigma factor [Clostridia bacterium]|nr:SigB/SigF/SigG family RNA polymerase sigma factor [Clostridia bacterium]